MSGIQAVSGSGVACGPREAHGSRQLPDKAISALADKLGMSADDLKAKLQDADDPRKVLDQLADEKGITRQELRETIRAAMPAHDQQGGEAGPPPPGGPSTISFDSEVGQKLLSSLAKTMNMSASDLKASLDGGTDLRDLLEEHNVSHEDVRAAFKDAFKSWQSYGASGTADSTLQPQYNAVDATA